MSIPVRISRDVAPTTSSAGLQVAMPRDVAPELTALAGAGRSVQQAGNYAFQMAMAEREQVQRDEIANADIADANAYNEYLQQSLKNPDWKTDEDRYKTWEKSHRTEILKSFTDEKARNVYSKKMGVQNAARLASVRKFQRQRHQEHIVANMPEMLEGFARNNLNEQGDSYLAGLQEGGWITANQKNAFSKQLETISKTMKADASEKLISDQAINIALAAEAEKEGSGWKAAQKWLNDPKTVKQMADTLDLTLGEVNALMADVKNQASLTYATQVEEIERARAEETDAVWGKINQFQFAGIDTYIDSQPTITNQQKVQLKAQAQKVADARIRERETDSETANMLYNEALRVSTGAITITEFNELLAENANNLSPDDYQKLYKTGADELDAAQAEALARANREGMAQIVTHASGTQLEVAMADISPAAQKKLIERRKSEFYALSQYNAELRAWVLKNEDAGPEEIFQKSEVLKLTYREKTFEAIQADINQAKEDAKDLTSELNRNFDSAFNTEAEKGNKIMLVDGKYLSFPEDAPIGAPILVPNKEAYDALPKGTWYVSRDGVVAIKGRGDTQTEPVTNENGGIIDGLNTETATRKEIISTYIDLAWQELGRLAPAEDVAKRAKELAKEKGWKL